MPDSPHEFCHRGKDCGSMFFGVECSFLVQCRVTSSSPFEPSRNKVTHEIAQGPCSQTTKEAGTSSQAKSKNRPVPSQEKIKAVCVGRAGERDGGSPLRRSRRAGGHRLVGRGFAR